MLISPPEEKLLDLPTMNLMNLFGRMRSMTDQAGFAGTLPAIWQCSDESQAVKKSLFGYVYNCPPINLGQAGALLDQTKLIPAIKHGKDIVILGGSHIGADEKEGIGYINRIHDQSVPCCGVLHRVLDEYLQTYIRATQLIKVFRDDEIVKIEIPYMYLFPESHEDRVTIQLKLECLIEGNVLAEIPYMYLFPESHEDRVTIQLKLECLIEGNVLAEGTHGKLFRLHPKMVEEHSEFATRQNIPQPIGRSLTSETFTFNKMQIQDSLKPQDRLEVSLFDFLPEIVTSSRPHKRLCDVNTWKQFHRVTAQLTDSSDTEDRNIFVLAGLTVDQTIQHSSFVPQFGFLMEKGSSCKSTYLCPAEINELLSSQDVYRPPVTFLEYAGES